MKPTLWESPDGTNYKAASGAMPGPLPHAVYKLQQSLTGPYLEKIGEKFPMPEKVYGLNRGFIDRVKRTIASTKDNLGVITSGIQGTGKTVTCEIICNELEYPVVVVQNAFEWLSDFLVGTGMDMVVFFDEFEKVFEGRASQQLLSVMDGALSTRWRRVFLMTTNALRIDENMLQRPGRIRYVKTFGNLSPSCIEEIVDDRLVSKNRRDSVIRFISELEIITIDIVMEVCREVNIHDEDPESFRDCFNVKRNTSYSTVYEVLEDGTEKVAVERAKIGADKFHDGWEGEDLYFDGKSLGEITEVLAPDTVIVKPEGKKYHKTYRLQPIFAKNQTYRVNGRNGAHTS
jgi:hypothetical protein